MLPRPTLGRKNPEDTERHEKNPVFVTTSYGSVDREKNEKHLRTSFSASAGLRAICSLGGTAAIRIGAIPRTEPKRSESA